ncbi:MAG: helix-turn-helix transcriptional regulator [Butyrivibrio sp.]|nr:helix-turn-helix transcriptional regulator [Butyrivibrio sp.]
MLMHKKLSVLRKQSGLTQEQLAEELNVSRQAVSKWERGEAVPDLNILIALADFYDIDLDSLARNDCPLNFGDAFAEKQAQNQCDYTQYIGKICDISVNCFRFSVLRNVEITGASDSWLCFVKNSRLGFVNIKKLLGGILVKKTGNCRGLSFSTPICGKCRLHVNNTYFGGKSYLLSEITEISENELTVKTGKFYAKESLDDISVILMSDKIKCPEPESNQ